MSTARETWRDAWAQARGWACAYPGAGRPSTSDPPPRVKKVCVKVCKTAGIPLREKISP